MGAGPAERLRSLGLELPAPPKPAGSYAPVVQTDGMAWVSGQIAVREGQVLHPGLVGRDVDIPTAQQVARIATLQALSALHATLGSLDRVRQILRVTVYVASAPGFDRQHEVANGATELLIAVFGEAGRPTRVSVGVVALPLNAPLEVELLARTG
ncbi:MAG TPA: RidA family protein [Thermoplasmata archaeon]|nr:RidA family protein [Thermoplasmata archaeon]